MSATPVYTLASANSTLAKAFGHLRLVDILAGLNAACRAWLSGELRSSIPSLSTIVTAWSTDPERAGTFRQWAREAAEALKKAIEQEKARGEDK